MPWSPPHPCRQPGCPQLVKGRSYCTAHAPRDTRPSARQRGYTGEWGNTRAQVIAEQPYCQCGAVAREVHHRIPLRQGGTHDRANLVAMCVSCHRKVTRQQMAGARA